VFGAITFPGRAGVAGRKGVRAFGRRRGPPYGPRIWWTCCRETPNRSASSASENRSRKSVGVPRAREGPRRTRYGTRGHCARTSSNCGRASTRHRSPVVTARDPPERRPQAGVPSSNVTTSPKRSRSARLPEARRLSTLGRTRHTTGRNCGTNHCVLHARRGE
jgi:hypothetical protein